MKLNGTHQLLVYADDVNILGGGIHTLKENATVLVFASKETGREVNADKTEYVLMSRDQNAGQYLNMKNDNSSFFYVLLTCILVIFDFMFQLNASFVCYIFSYSSTCFEQYCAHHQEDLLYIHSIWFFVCHSS